jgi:anti-anti-sigma regulatory factor
VREDSANKNRCRGLGKDIDIVCAGSKQIILNMTGATSIDVSGMGELVAVSTASLA